jgi:hypothetical protein
MRDRASQDDAELVRIFLQLTEGQAATVVGRVCGLDGQTIQNLRRNRISRIRAQTRRKLENYITHLSDRSPSVKPLSIVSVEQRSGRVSARARDGVDHRAHANGQARSES